MERSSSIVYLIPSLLDEEAFQSIPPCIPEAIRKCQVYFVENERSARRYLKKIWKEIQIDSYEWFEIGKAENEMRAVFTEQIRKGKIIGIISEAGCPGVADPGQALVYVAQQMDVDIRPLVGPNSILLALMGSGLNGQQFTFVGYLPIREPERQRAIKELESESQKKNFTQIFIETPYRNNQLLESVLKTCNPGTRLCIAAGLTGKYEWIKTKTIAEWKKETMDLKKRPAIFLMLAEQEFRRRK